MGVNISELKHCTTATGALVQLQQEMHSTQLQAYDAQERQKSQEYYGTEISVCISLCACRAAKFLLGTGRGINIINNMMTI